jgi:hypothetical protein
MNAYQIGYLFGTLATPFLYMLIIGTIYYLIKKRRIPFRQAVINRWVIIASLVLFFLGLLSRTGLNLKQESSHVYSERVVTEFTAGCVETAKERVDSKIAEQM